MTAMRRCARTPAASAPREFRRTAAAILARHAPLTVVMADFFRKLRQESRQTPYPLEEIRRIGCR